MRQAKIARSKIDVRKLIILLMSVGFYISDFGDIEDMSDNTQNRCLKLAEEYTNLKNNLSYTYSDYFYYAEKYDRRVIADGEFNTSYYVIAKSPKLTISRRYNNISKVVGKGSNKRAIGIPDRKEIIVSGIYDCYNEVKL